MEREEIFEFAKLVVLNCISEVEGPCREIALRSLADGAYAAAWCLEGGPAREKVELFWRALKSLIEAGER